MPNNFLLGCAAVALTLGAPLAAHAAVFDVKAFGAKADGKTLDRVAINKAIDAAVAAGGGTVFFPAGTYLTGSIRLRSNLTMRDVANSPIFLRLGSRLRAPEGTTIGSLRRVSISNVVVYDADPRFGSIITGIPGHDVEDIKLSNIRIVYRGGLTLEHAARQPAEMASTFFAAPRRGSPVPAREPFDVPEQEKLYPEPAMFGVLPAYGFFIRHAKGIELNNVEVGFMQEDRRPAFVLDDVSGADFQHVKAQKATGIPTIVLRKVEDFTARACTPLPDTKIPQVDRREM